MVKSVKSLISLILALVAAVCLCVAWIPLTPLTGMGINGQCSFFGTINFVLAVVGLISAIVAVVFAVLAKKEGDKSGRRTASLVIGIIAIILTILSSPVLGILSTFTEFVNSDGQKGLIAEIVREDKDLQKQIDNAIAEIKGAAK